MKLIALRCRRCGGPLRLPDNISRVTCLHCGARLKVVGLGAAAHTESLEALDQRAGQIETHVDNLHLRSAIAELDRQWEVEREQYYLVGNFLGVPIRRRPDRTHDRAVAAVVVGGGTLLAALLTYTMHTEWGVPGLQGWIALLLPALPLLVALAGLRNAIRAHRHANRYEQAEQQHLRRRAALENGEELPGAS